MRRVAAVKWVDHRLNDGNGAIVGAGVRPAFKVVCAVDMPVRELRGLVHMRAEMNDGLDLAQARIELQIGGSRVDRVAVKDDQPVHIARVHVGDQRLQIVGLDRGQRIDGLGINHRLAHVAERLIDRDGRQMNGG